MGAALDAAVRGADMTAAEAFTHCALALYAQNVDECRRAYGVADAVTRKNARDIYGEDGAWRHFASPELIAFDRVARECSR